MTVWCVVELLIKRGTVVWRDNNTAVLCYFKPAFPARFASIPDATYYAIRLFSYRSSFSCRSWLHAATLLRLCRAFCRRFATYLYRRDSTCCMGGYGGRTFF